MNQLPLDPNRLLPIAGEHRAAFAEADPFPHVIIDGLFDPNVLNGVVAEYPSTDGPVD
ncbi:hypothetical protein [Rhabdothermincola salaria]|uniref:hypothetical protein n=1 Tax=Rhabdothermincola salaria TaxID=2903142 RepID=UPI001E522C12|nr:hypothetical protein [Rhabdothermincola salaria]MCD9622755.1 hypothetical protein [Rhabdothermincola salaria]